MGRASWHDKHCQAKISFADPKYGSHGCGGKRIRLYDRTTGNYSAVGWFCPECGTMELDQPITLRRMRNKQEVVIKILRPIEETDIRKVVAGGY